MLTGSLDVICSVCESSGGLSVSGPGLVSSLTPMRGSFLEALLSKTPSQVPWRVGTLGPKGVLTTGFQIAFVSFLFGFLKATC